MEQEPLQTRKAMHTARNFNNPGDLQKGSTGALVAGGGFVPQSLIDSVQLTDSTMVRNAKKGDKGDLFIQFSFSFGHRHEQKRWAK